MGRESNKRTSIKVNNKIGRKNERSGKRGTIIGMGEKTLKLKIEGKNREKNDGHYVW
jgi:hypothetical protein